ncbi:MAG: putative inner membrane transporter YhbE [SAR92 bacterium MED-G29]|nr:DMT family transporter [Porticoccaceae bacterium]CAI8288654.1 MAG: putative inner membrane transporter YhbE [SAR92 bacterium MED-G29]
MTAVSGRWRLGLLLALSTAIMWGVLPIALTGVMVTLDPMTTTFFRLSLAAVVLTPILLVRKRLPNLPKLRSPRLFLQLLAAGLLLSANYGLYISGLERTSPEASQVMIQLAPMLLLLAGIFLFKESFSPAQWIGFFAFASGLALFFNHHLSDIFVSLNDYGIGLLMLCLAALCWTGYAVLQKILLQEFSSEETMLAIYWLGTLVFLPFCDFSTIGQLSGLQWGLLAFCGLNTLIAYGAFAEALVHIEASRVSATIALTPLLTVSIVQFVPIAGITAEPLQFLSIVGAIMVVCGSMTTAIAKKR